MLKAILDKDRNIYCDYDLWSDKGSDKTKDESELKRTCPCQFVLKRQDGRIDLSILAYRSNEDRKLQNTILHHNEIIVNPLYVDIVCLF
jgi:hypothetical protein